MADKNKWWISPETLVGIANAIRSKKGTTDLIPVTELKDEILSITGGDANLQNSKTVNISKNGTTEIKADSGYNGIVKAVVNVNVPTESGEITLQEKIATENGEVTADEGYDGLSKVTVNVPSETPNLVTKDITANGEYKAEDLGADGFSSVNVNVQSEEVELNGIRIDHNGDYEATAFGWDGFSFVSVNVPSVNDTYTGEVTIEVTFTIDGVSYQAKDGTKWYEWVNSDYNTGNFTCATENAAVYNSDSTKYVVTADSTTVNGSVTIKAMAYTLMEEEKEIDINGTWVLNETLTPDFIEEGRISVSIRFTTPAYPDVTFSDILRQDKEGEGSELWYMAAESQEVYQYGVGWLNKDARTITITYSKNAPDAFKAALIANGTKQE